MVRNEKLDASPTILRGFFRRGHFRFTVSHPLNEARGRTPTMSGERMPGAKQSLWREHTLMREPWYVSLLSTNFEPDTTLTTTTLNKSSRPSRYLTNHDFIWEFYAIIWTKIIKYIHVKLFVNASKLMNDLFTQFFYEYFYLLQCKIWNPNRNRQRDNIFVPEIYSF